MYIFVDENPNCAGDERVFAASGDIRVVSQVQIEQLGNAGPAWCDVSGVEEGGGINPAKAVLVEDSSDGTAWLIFGGSWGLRFTAGKNQWGLPFLVLDSSGSSIRFK